MEVDRESLPPVMNTAEAAEFLRLEVTTLYRLANSRKVPCRKVGGRWRFWRASLERFMETPTEKTGTD